MDYLKSLKKSDKKMTRPKVKVYIDGANMFYTQKKLGWFFDWKKIKKIIEKKYDAQETRFYIGYKEDDIEMEGFLRALRRIGFKTITKPVKWIRLGDKGQGEEKANFDVEITRDILLDILWFKNRWDGIVFLSGDSDFAPLFWDLKKIFIKKVFVFSSRFTLSWELRLAATEHFFLEDFKKKIFRRNWDLTRKEKSGIRKSLNRRS